MAQGGPQDGSPVRFDDIGITRGRVPEYRSPGSKGHTKMNRYVAAVLGGGFCWGFMGFFTRHLAEV